MRRLIPLLLVLALVAGAGYYVYRTPGAWEEMLARAGLAPTPAGSTPAAISASGFIEVDQVTVAPEISGRIVWLGPAEGDQVQQGQPVARIDTDLIDAQIVEAQAAVEVARAQLARIQAGARSEDVALAEAGVKLAQAQSDAAYQAWQDAIALRDNPQDLQLQIAAARTQLAVAEQRVLQTGAIKDAAEIMAGLRERQARQADAGFNVTVKTPAGPVTKHVDLDPATKDRIFYGWNLATSDVWTAWANYDGAQAMRDAAQRDLDNLLAQQQDPQQAVVQVAQAEAAYKQAAAGVEVAKAKLALAQAGATAEQIGAAQAAVAQAQTAVDTLQTQRAKYEIVSPISGLVIERTVHEGEMATPGVSLLTVASLDSVQLRLFIPEPDMGLVHLGQKAEVSVDAYPGEKFTGEVVWIASEAEFTPKNVQTKEERAKTVFAVKIRLPNADHRLRPGMPADAVLQ